MLKQKVGENVKKVFISPITQLDHSRFKWNMKLHAFFKVKSL